MTAEQGVDRAGVDDAGVDDAGVADAGVAFAVAMWADDEASRGLGMEALVIERDHAIVRMPIRHGMVNGHDICHGGFVFTLADSTFALACNSRGETTVAAGGDITFTAPAVSVTSSSPRDGCARHTAGAGSRTSP